MKFDLYKLQTSFYSMQTIGKVSIIQ